MDRSRTDLEGFAVLCLAAWLPRLEINIFIIPHIEFLSIYYGVGELFVFTTCADVAEVAAAAGDGDAAAAVAAVADSVASGVEVEADYRLLQLRQLIRRHRR